MDKWTRSFKLWLFLFFAGVVGCEKKLPLGLLTRPPELKRALGAGLDANAADAEGKTLLHHAASMNLLQAIEILGEAGANIAAKDTQGKTALHEASLQGWPEAVRLLCEKGCPVDARDAWGWTAIHEACHWQRGTAAVIGILLEYGADVNVRGGSQQKTPLHVAIDANNLEAVAFLLGEGADIDLEDKIDGTPLFAAVRKNRVAAAQLIVSKKPDLWRPDNGRWLAVEVAYHTFGDSEIFRLLLGETDLDGADEKGRTLLHRAVMHDKPDFAAILISKGVPLDRKDNYGNTAADLIARIRPSAATFRRLLGVPDDQSAGIRVAEPSEAGMIEQIRRDIAEGKDVNERPGGTYLHTAAAHGYVGVMEMLLQNGANPNVVDSDGHAPLHLAALEGKPDAIRFLLRHESDANARNSWQLTAIEMSLMYGKAEKRKIFELLRPRTSIIDDREIMGKVAVTNNLEAIEILLDAGVDVNMLVSGEGLMHTAIRRRDLRLLQMVVDHGADSELRDHHGYRPYDYLKDDHSEWAKEARRLLAK